MLKHALHRVVSTSRDDDLDYYLLMSPDASTAPAMTRSAWKDWPLDFHPTRHQSASWRLPLVCNLFETNHITRGVVLPSRRSWYPHSFIIWMSTDPFRAGAAVTGIPTFCENDFLRLISSIADCGGSFTCCSRRECCGVCGCCAFGGWCASRGCCWWGWALNGSLCGSAFAIKGCCRIFAQGVHQPCPLSPSAKSLHLSSVSASLWPRSRWRSSCAALKSFDAHHRARK